MIRAMRFQKRTQWVLVAAATVLLAPAAMAQDDPGELKEGQSDLDVLITMAHQLSPVLLLARAEVDKASSKLADRQLQIARDAVAAYTTLRDGRKSLETASKAFEQAKMQVEVGVGTHREMLMARREMEAVELAFREAVADCYYLMGQVPKGEVDELPDATMAAMPQTLAEFLERTAASHPALAVARAEEELAEAQFHNRTMEVIRDLTAAHSQLHWRRNAAKMQQEAMEQTRLMVRSGRTTPAALNKDILALAQTESLIAELEATIRYLAGGPLPQSKKGPSDSEGASDR